MKNKWLKNTRHWSPPSWLLHLLLWVVVFLLPYIFPGDAGLEKQADSDDFRNLDTATNLFWIGLFYLNAFVLSPRLLFRRKYLSFLALALLCFLGIMLLHGALFPWLVTTHQFNLLPSSRHNIIPFLFTLLVSTAFYSIDAKQKTDKAASSLQEENLRTELSFLRSQINPHFLFNMLNNIVSMARLKSDELESTVVKLSALLHYMLYDNNGEKLLLRNELESMRNFIDLQRLRFSDSLRLYTRFDVTEDWLSIEPMLLIPFVENAFKHGNGLLTSPEILITLSTEKGQLLFECRNRFMPSDTAKDNTGGIGLVNVTRRLQLLYPGRHTLTIKQTGDWFAVGLAMTLQ